MTSQNKKQNIAGKSPQNPDRNNMRWIVGFVILFFGLFAAASTFFSFFCWQEDQSLFDPTTLQTEIRTARESLSDDAANPCGRLGARLGWWLVDCSFGLFGIIIPLLIAWIGLRMITQKELNFNRTILPFILVMLFGSLTFGFLFPHMDICSEEGPGGAFGVLVASILSGYIGTVGMIFLLLSGWILLCVLINRNFINTVNSAGNLMVDRSERIVEAVKSRVAQAKEEVREEEAASKPVATSRPVEPAPQGAEPAPQPVPPTWESAVSEEGRNHFEPEEEFISEEERQPAQQPEPQSVGEDFTIGEETTSAPQPVTASRRTTPTDEEELFTEVDVEPAPRTRVVMGRGGLIELAPVMPRKTVPQTAPTEPRNTPFVGDPTGNPAEPKPLADPEDFKAIVEEVSAEQHETVQLEEPTPAPHETEAGIEIDKPEADGGVVVDVEEHHEELTTEEQLPEENYDPLKDLINYRKPSFNLLEDYQTLTQVSDEEIYENKSNIEETLKNFGIPIQKIKATVGPTVTLYEIVQAQGVKISKIQGLENDIAQSLKALGIRIIAPIPGKGTIGIEVPNRDKEVVSMYSCVRSVRFQESKAQLPVVIGRTIQNENYVFDLAKMPHLLVAGATGQGKSVGLNAIITSLLYRKHPAQLKFVLIDPKMVEFSLYSKIERHFLAKMESEDEAVVTDPQKAVYTLNSLCVEMDNRLELCKKAGTRNIAEYNEKFIARRLNPQKGHRYLPYIVVIVDEFADLIMTAKEVEGPVMRLAQKARAIGIHLIIATQRPDVKVITGGIKANFPARMAFRVMQMIDSRTIIDQPGANQLIGRGDMLFSKDGELTRIQCALVETKEVERIVDYIATQQGYTEAYPLPDYTPESSEGTAMGSDEAPVKYDTLFAQIARDVVVSGQISTSMIQRNYEVGFNRAGRIMLQLERSGIVGKQHGAKPRDILILDLPTLEAKLQDLGVF